VLAQNDDFISYTVGLYFEVLFNLSRESLYWSSGKFSQYSAHNTL
jgi:hypothetical protein